MKKTTIDTMKAIVSRIEAHEKVRQIRQACFAKHRAENMADEPKYTITVEMAHPAFGKIAADVEVSTIDVLFHNVVCNHENVPAELIAVHPHYVSVDVPFDSDRMITEGTLYVHKDLAKLDRKSQLQQIMIGLIMLNIGMTNSVGEISKDPLIRNAKNAMLSRILKEVVIEDVKVRVEYDSDHIAKAMVPACLRADYVGSHEGRRKQRNKRIHNRSIAM